MDVLDEAFCVCWGSRNVGEWFPNPKDQYLKEYETR